MKLRSIVLSLTILAATSGLYALDSPRSYVGETAIFALPTKTDVPGKTMPPGKYFILVVDQYSDRMIVRVENEATKDHSIFLGVPQPALGTGSKGPVEWNKGPSSGSAMRGYTFSPGLAVEFVYPKDEAVGIATKNAAKVIAVDPQSEGMPELKNMSKDDMQMVNLWALSLTTVGAKDTQPAIEAKKYESLPINAPQPAVASSGATVGPPAPIDQRNVASLEKPRLGVNGDNTTAPAPAKRRPVIAKLPHTASPFALIVFLGIFFLTAGELLRLGSKFVLARSSKG